MNGVVHTHAGPYEWRAIDTSAWLVPVNERDVRGAIHLSIACFSPISRILRVYDKSGIHLLLAVMLDTDEDYRDEAIRHLIAYGVVDPVYMLAADFQELKC